MDISVRSTRPSSGLTVSFLPPQSKSIVRITVPSDVVRGPLSSSSSISQGTAAIRVAHGIGSDPDDDSFASVFSNVQDSLSSSLGAARGAERYYGINGLSLRLDGLETSNSQMRARAIVVHSYVPERRRYFNADLIAMRGKPGPSEGCFVVEPDKREWILETLENGGFIYSGYSGQLPQPIVPVANPNVIFARGTGTSSQMSLAAPLPQQASGTPVGTPGSPPTNPTSQEPAASGQ